MDKFLALFSFRGRTNRARYWLTIVLNYLLVICGSFAMLGLVRVAPVFGLAWLILGIVALLVGLAVVVRRLHDRNKSAWWILPMFGPVLLFNGLGLLASLGGAGETIVNAVRVLALPFSIWALVELGCLKGASGPNRFGPDPLQPEPAEVFA